MPPHAQEVTMPPKLVMPPVPAKPKAPGIQGAGQPEFNTSTPASLPPVMRPPKAPPPGGTHPEALKPPMVHERIEGGITTSRNPTSEEKAGIT